MSCQTPSQKDDQVLSLPKVLKSKKGFTLVEVLIVLVIISIMAGLLITVIDPVKQRQRAQDGTLVATANKIVAAVEAYNSAVGTYPTCAELVAGEIGNATATHTCTASSGSFTIGGLTYPQDSCNDTTGGYASGTGVCSFRYGVNSTGDKACLGLRLNLPTNLDSDGTSGSYLIWDSAVGHIADEGSAPGFTAPTCTY